MATAIPTPEEERPHCAQCPNPVVAKNLCRLCCQRKRYQEDPEFRAKKREYQRKRYQEDPEVRTKIREYQRKRRQDPEVRAKIREYDRKRRQDPEVRAKRREYDRKRRQDPEVRAKRREYDRKRRAKRHEWSDCLAVPAIKELQDGNGDTDS